MLHLRMALPLTASHTCTHTHTRTHTRTHTHAHAHARTNTLARARMQVEQQYYLRAPLTWLTAAPNSCGLSFSSAAAMSGGHDHTMLARPSCPRTGSSASGPVGRNRCQAVPVLTQSAATSAPPCRQQLHQRHNININCTVSATWQQLHEHPHMHSAVAGAANTGKALALRQQ
jgi:hypothetical protein